MNTIIDTNDIVDVTKHKTANLTELVKRMQYKAQQCSDTSSQAIVREDDINYDEKQQILHALMQSFNGFIYQKYQDIFTRMSIKETDIHETVIEDRFLHHRVIDINSYIHVLKLRSKNKSIAKHRKILIRAAILSLTNGDFTMPDLVCDKGCYNPNDNLNNRYTERQMQRLIHERYQYMFLEPKLHQKAKDSRVKQISSVFSGEIPRITPINSLTQAYLDAGCGMALDRSGKDMEQLTRNAMLRMAFPQLLEDLIAVRDECRTVFESLGAHNSKIDFLREHLVENAGLLDVFYSHITSILDLVWFQTKTEDKKKCLLKPCPNAKYNCKDAKKARNMLVGIYGVDMAYRILNTSGVIFLQYERPDAAICVFNECVSMTKNDMNCGIGWQNIAISHRINQKYKLSLGAMEKALIKFKITGDAYRICNAQQLIGENQWCLGFKNAALKSFEDIEKYCMRIKKDKRWMSQFIIGMSFWRLKEWTLRKRYFVKALELMPEGDTEHVLWLNKLIDDECTIDENVEFPPKIKQEISKAMQITQTLIWNNSDKSTSVDVAMNSSPNEKSEQKGVRNTP